MCREKHPSLIFLTVLEWRHVAPNGARIWGLTVLSTHIPPLPELRNSA